MRGRRGIGAALRALGVLGFVLVFAGVVAPAVRAEFPYLPKSGGDAHNPATFKVPPGDVPTNLKDDFKFAATPEQSAQSAMNNMQPDELCGVRGASIADQAATQPAGSCLPAGSTVHTAFNVSTGRPDVTIAVLDSGIEWNNRGAMTDLRKKVRINAGELPAPQVDTHKTSLDPSVDCTKLSSPDPATTKSYDPKAHNYDVNNDGVFNVLDYACDDRVSVTESGRHGPPGVLTPEDIILAFSDGVDHDHNGYVNDIAGWNYVDNRNNPYDDVQYGHGTGEARDSNAEANTTGDLGTCPNCMVLPLRVGESFIADVNRFAQAVLYATDNNVLVIQEALGTLNNSTIAGQAVNYAYNHGTAVIASAADEAAEHHNQPGALPHTIVVNSVRPYDATFTPTPRSYLQFNGCTNFSTKVVVSVPSTSCSSEATGKSAGVAGLIYSAAINAHSLPANAPGYLPASTDCKRPDGTTPCVITANEVRQLMGSGHIGSTEPADTGNGGQADDVNFEFPSPGSPASNPAKSCTIPAPTPVCTDPNSFTFAPDQNGGTVVSPLATTRRYPARKGFDEFYGYGRLNAYNAVSAAGKAAIPPEAEINSPDWFQQIDPSPSSLPVEGHVDARGAESYKCQVYVAPGGQPNNGLTTDTPPGDFKAVSNQYCDGSTSRTGAFDGTLGTLNLQDLKSRFPSTVNAAGNSFRGNENGGTTPQTSNGRPNTLPYAFTVRVVVTTVGGSPAMSGEDRRQMFLHRDQDMLAGFPKELHTDGDSSPLLVNLAGDNRNQLVLATSDGVIHAYRPDGSELPGWPVHTDQLPLHLGERAFTSGTGVTTDHYGAVLGGLAAGDLFHDGRMEIVADDNQGKVYAWDAAGNQVFKAEANPAYSGDPVTSFQRQGPRDRVEHGFFASPVLADLEGTAGKLDIIAAGEDRHLYAWHPDGTSVPGFPVLVEDPKKVASVDPTTHYLTFKSDAGNAQLQGKIVDTPAVAQLDGPTKPPSIVVGTNEEYQQNNGSEGPINANGVNTASLGALAQTGVLTFGNSRLYVVKPNGNLSNDPFRTGWPKAIGQITQELLPDVGEGITGGPVVGSVGCARNTNSGGPKIGVIPDAGPGYLFNPDGSSCYGSANGQDTALQTDASAGAPGSSTGQAQADHPAFPAVGNPAFGNIGPGGQTAFLAPAAGLLRALDAAAPEYQTGSQDFLAAWNPTSGQFQSGFPSPVNDLQFLTGPAIGDVTGGAVSQQAAVEGTASLDLAAINPAGMTASANWPKLTGDWTVANPLLGSFGTIDTDPAAKKAVVSITRSGTLAVYTTPAGACSASSWPRFHHDLANSGDLNRDAVPPGQPSTPAIFGGQLTFTAPGDDLLCGTVDHYEVVQSDSQITYANFAAAEHLDARALAPVAAGKAQSFALPSNPKGYVAVRAIDKAGNIGPFAVISTVDASGSGVSGSAGSGSAGSGSGGPGSAGAGSGTTGAGGSGSGAGRCSPKRPSARFARHRARANRHGLRLRGTARAARGCPSRVIRVTVSVARAVGKRCRFLRANGTFGRTTSCRRNLYLPAVGTTHWHFDFRTKLARGHYKVFARATNAAGIAERRNYRLNYVALRVR